MRNTYIIIPLKSIGDINLKKYTIANETVKNFV